MTTISDHLTGIVRKTSGRRGHSRDIFQVGCANSFSAGGQTSFFANLSVLVFVLFQTMITGRDDDIEFARMSNFPGKNYRCFRETLKQGFFSFLTAFNLCNPMTTRKFCAMNKNLLQKYKNDNIKPNIPLVFLYTNVVFSENSTPLVHIFS